MQLQKFYKASIITVILLYILILVGGFVRITNSGDDCPDWPKCYGSWIPPFSIEDIPDKYIKKGEQYNDINKNGVWDEDEPYCDIGFDRCSDSYEDGNGGCYCDFFNDPESCELIKKSNNIIEQKLDPNHDNWQNGYNLLIYTDGNGRFDPADTEKDLQDKVYGSWIEYFNRIVGVVLGISMLFTFFKSIPFFKKNHSLFIGSLTSLLFIIIAGWFGGQIADNIDGGNVIYQHSVSIHLYIAILTVISLVYTTNESFLLMYPNSESSSEYSNASKYLLYAILALNLFLVLSGSFIRTFLDNDTINQLPYFIRMEQYLDDTGFIKFLHPIFGFSMLASCAILWNHIINMSQSSKIIQALTKILLYLIGMQILIGEGLRFSIIHESFRLYHLWISTVILGLIITMLQRIKYSK